MYLAARLRFDKTCFSEGNKGEFALPSVHFVNQPPFFVRHITFRPFSSPLAVQAMERWQFDGVVRKASLISTEVHITRIHLCLPRHIVSLSQCRSKIMQHHITSPKVQIAIISPIRHPIQ